MNALVLQCGGPTAVINRTLAAIVRQWRNIGVGGELHGGRHGLAALVSGDWLALSRVPDEWLAGVERAPGMALGGGRNRLDDQDFDRAAALLRTRAVGIVFLIGGNGTMAAGRALRAAADRAGTRLRIVGIPKTIDNDIPCTDVTPGFPSAAQFLIEAVHDIGIDAASMRGYEDVVLVETMGRHAGWLAASTLLARLAPDDPPHLVLVPEQPVADTAFLEQVRERQERLGVCVITVAEGVRDRAGSFFAEHANAGGVERDAGGQVILGRSGGPLPYFATLIRERLHLRCRLVRPDLLQRCSRAHVTALDRTIASLVGSAAVDRALADAAADPEMIALRRTSAGWATEAVPLDEIRGERTLPPGPLDAALLQALLGHEPRTTQRTRTTRATDNTDNTDNTGHG